MQELKLQCSSVKYFGGACPHTSAGEHAHTPPRGSMPTHLRELICSSICFKVTPPEKNCSKNVKIKILCPSKKSSEFALDMKHFQRAYLPPFPGLNVEVNVFVFIVNIQPSSKLHSPPRKFSGFAPAHFIEKQFKR